MRDATNARTTSATGRVSALVRSLSSRSRILELRGYPLEPLVLALVALAALPVVHLTTAQDVSRLTLTRQIALHGSLELDPWAARGIDRARYGGRWYSDKAPGFSFLALPSYEVVRAAGADGPPRSWILEGDLHLWLLRVLTGGVAFLASVFLVGRAAEGAAAGTGGATAVTYGLGTLAGPLAATTFGHVTAAVLGFGAFLLASRRRLLAAGLCAGLAFLVDYQTGLVAAVVLAYAVAIAGRRAGACVLGLVPPLVVLGVYDRLAFGSPFHLSYRYVANRFTGEQQRGFFGIGIPTAHSLQLAVVGPRGLLTLSPVLVAAVAGLWLLWRRAPLEAAVCAVVTVLFLVATCGYFLPYGGRSPGPRFFAPALPFLALGLPLAFRRWPRTTALLAAASVALTLIDDVTWALRPDEDPRYFPLNIHLLAQTVWLRLIPNRVLGALLMAAAAAAALAVTAARRLSVKTS